MNNILSLFLQNPRILVVDDDRDYAALIAELLTNQGAQVKVAFEGIGAFAIAKTFEPDLVLSDFSMPIMSGDKLLAELRKHGYKKPFILLTGTTEVDQVIAALHNGTFDYLVKPISSQVLVAAVQNALRNEYQRLLIEAELNELYEMLTELKDPKDAYSWKEFVLKKATSDVKAKRQTLASGQV